jgi:hypothetical protein
MFPPIHEAVAVPAVTALLGSDPLRFYPFGHAPQDTVAPYAVWQVVFGSPENYLSGRPDLDGFGVQVDVYAPTGTVARQVAAALRDALELVAYISAWRGESRDNDTGLIRFSFDVDFLSPRGTT